MRKSCVSFDALIDLKKNSEVSQMTDNLPQNAEKSIKKTEGLTEKEQERLSDWREKSQDMKLNYRQKIVPEDGEPANYYQPIKKEGVDHKTICDLAEADHYRLLAQLYLLKPKKV